VIKFIYVFLSKIVKNTISVFLLITFSYKKKYSLTRTKRNNLTKPTIGKSADFCVYCRLELPIFREAAPAAIKLNGVNYESD